MIAVSHVLLPQEPEDEEQLDSIENKLDAVVDSIAELTNTVAEALKANATVKKPEDAAPAENEEGEPQEKKKVVAKVSVKI